MFFDIEDIYESQWGTATTNGEVSITSCSTRQAGEEDGVDTPDVEVWPCYGLSYLPKRKDNDGQCQALTLKLGSQKMIVGTRDSRAQLAHGDLSEGDVALWSVGKNCVKLNSDSTIAIIQRGDPYDASILCEEDGTWKFANQYGVLELGKNGMVWVGADGGVAQFSKKQHLISGESFQANTGTCSLGVGATVPLVSIPTLPSGFASPKPTPNIFV